MAKSCAGNDEKLDKLQLLVNAVFVFRFYHHVSNTISFYHHFIYTNRAHDLHRKEQAKFTEKFKWNPHLPRILIDSY